MIVLPYVEHAPRIGPRVAAHASSAVIGRTEIGPDCSLAELTLLRADGEDVRVGADCWFGEASTVHIADRVYPALIGSHVTVGRYGLVHACTVGDDCVIGEHAAVMDGSVLGPGAVVAAESIVPPGKKLEGGWLYAGAPARPVERVSSTLLEQLHRAIRSGAGRQASRVFAASQVFAASRAPDLRHAPGSGTAGPFGRGVYVAPTASLAGRVVLAPECSVWFGVEIDAGEATVEIGERTNVQDNSRLYAGKHGEDIRIGPRVVIGHNVRIFPSTIEADAIIGMEAVIGKGTIVRTGGLVAAGSVTEPGTDVAPGQVWSGRPARAARVLSERNREEFSRAVDIYVEYAANFAKACPAPPG
jgi:carbonic anhydrase/acetyltransferase-like protein (isoleucine patch superfamily)